MMNRRPIGPTKQVRILIALTLLAWATQTLFRQWGYGQTVSVDAAPADVSSAADLPTDMQFVPKTSGADGGSSNGLVAGAGSMELRPEATVFGRQVTVKQLCRWADSAGAAFANIADLTVARFDKGSASTTVTLDDLRNTLRDAGVNTAVITFSGPQACRVTRADAAADNTAGVSDADADRAGLMAWLGQKRAGIKSAEVVAFPAAAVLPATTVSGDAVADAECNPFKTLRDRLLIDLSQRLNLPVEKLQVNFDAKDGTLLSLAEPAFHFEVDGRRVLDLGRVSWNVQVMTEGGQQKATVTADARAWQTEAVVRKPLAYREVLRADDVDERRVLVDRLPEDPLIGKSQLVGQEATRDLPAGSILTGRLVDAVPLAKAGQFVTITLNQGTVQVKTVAKAMEGGSYGQAIKVRNDETRDVYEVTLTGPQTATLGPAQPEVGLASGRD